jgi:hypothetical protein
MEAGGKFRLPAAQLREADGPIVLYSTNQKYYTNDYFLLEYRTPNTRSAGPGYDADVDSAGMVVYHFYANEPQWKVPFVYVECPPNLVPGGTNAWPAAWPGGSTTPLLKWLDGQFSKTRIYVHPFEANADFITIEISTAKDTYVDVTSTVQPENGTITNPYNTLAEGLAAAPWGSTLYVKGGTHTLEEPQITKALRLVTYGSGHFTIGL